VGILKKVARSIVFPALMKSGVDRLIKAISPNSCVHVMYHGVVQQDSTYFSPRHITATQFEAQLKYFKKHFDVISMAEAFHRVQHNVPFARKTITVSFDDGFQNNLTNALPLLEKHQIPTTIFVSGVCVSNKGQEYLWSEISAALNYFHPSDIMEVDGYRFQQGVDASGLRLNDWIKRLSYDKRERVLSDLIARFDLDAQLRRLPDEIWKLLSREEVIELSKSSVIEIGSHAYNHYNLAEIEVEMAREELILSKRLLEEAIQKPVISLAYPDGSYNAAIKDVAEQAGYERQLAVSYKLTTDQQDLRIMDRHGIASTTTFESNMLFLNLAFRKKGSRG